MQRATVLCGVGGDINLSTPSAGTGATYSWTGPNGFSSTSRQPTNGNVGTGDAGNYTVTVTLKWLQQPKHY
jgi:hypothetical protein